MAGDRDGEMREAPLLEEWAADPPSEVCTLSEVSLGVVAGAGPDLDDPDRQQGNRAHVALGSDLADRLGIGSLQQ